MFKNVSQYYNISLANENAINQNKDIVSLKLVEAYQLLF